MTTPSLYDRLMAAANGVPSQTGSTADTEERTVGGFLSNLVGGVKDLGLGIAGLGGQVVHDVGRGVAQALPGGQSWGFINDTDPTGYHLDDIAKALPRAIIEDYSRRYGGGLSGILEGLYEDPLSYILDALAVGSAAAKGAEIAGLAALKGSGAAATAERVAEGLRLAGSGKTAVRAGIRAGLDELAEAGNLSDLGRLSRAVLPSQSVRRVGESLVPYAPTSNPVARALSSPLRRVGTEPLDVLRSEAATLNDEMAAAIAAGREVPAPVRAQYGKLTQMIEGAERVGVSRLARPQVARMTEWNAARKAVGEATARWLRNREGRLQAVYDTLRPYVRADKSFAERSAGVFDGLDVHIEDLPQSVWASTVKQIVAAPKVARIGDSSRIVTSLQPELAADVRTAAEATIPTMVQRVDELVQGVRDWLDNALAHPERLRRDLDPDALRNAADRYVSGLYDVVRRRVAHERGKRVLPDTVLAQDDARLMTASWQQDLLSRGDDIEHIMERTYRPLAMKHGAKYVDGKLDGPDWRALDDALRAADIPQPVYFPYIERDVAKAGFWDFLMNRSRIGSRRASRDPHLLQMKGTLLERGNYIVDPIDAYGRRAARAVKAEEVQSLIDNVVKPAARKISSVDELTPGEAIYAPDGLWRFWRTKTTFDDVMDDLLSQGFPADESIAQALKAVVFKNQDELAQMGTTGSGLDLYAIPKALARQLDAYAKWSGAVSSPAVRLFWDKPLDVWRAFVLQGSPRWIVNNVLGNTIFIKMTGGASVSDVIRIAEDRFKRYLNERLGTDFDTKILDRIARLEGMERVGSGFSSKESLYQAKLGAAGEGTVGQVYARLANAAPVRAAKKAGGFMQRFNSAVEDTFRQATYIRALERQQIISNARRVSSGMWSLKNRLDRLMDNGISEGQVRSALDSVASVMGDYGSLGPLERNVVRRFFFPFWGFYRHQARLLLTFPIEYPGRAAILEQLADANREFLEQYGEIPEWLQGAVPMGRPGGEVPFLTTRGPSPFSASFEPPTSMLSPPLKVAFEQSTGRNLFTGQEFTDENVVTPYGSGQSFRYQTDDAGNVIGVEPVERVTPGLIEHLLQQVPQYQAAKQTIAGGKTYDTATLLDVLQGRGVQTDYTGAPRYPTNVGEQVARLSGLSTYEYDLAAYQQLLSEQAAQALVAAMRLQVSRTPS